MMGYSGVVASIFFHRCRDDAVQTANAEIFKQTWMQSERARENGICFGPKTKRMSWHNVPCNTWKISLILSVTLAHFSPAKTTLIHSLSILPANGKIMRYLCFKYRTVCTIYMYRSKICHLSNKQTSRLKKKVKTYLSQQILCKITWKQAI